MRGTGLPTKVTTRVPPGYERIFVTKGHRATERMFGSRSDRHVKWREMLGGLDVLKAKRRKFLNGEAWG